MTGKTHRLSSTATGLSISAGLFITIALIAVFHDVVLSILVFIGSVVLLAAAWFVWVDLTFSYRYRRNR